MISDTHIHTHFSGDSTTPPQAQIDRCLSLGMREMCITDHHDYEIEGEEEVFLLDFASYLPCMEQLRREYENRIQVNIGVELGLQLHVKPYLETLVSELNVDYIIGSSHFIDRQDPYFPQFFEGKSEREAYRRYFEVTLNRIQQMDCFDAFGHLDYVVRYGPTTNQNYSYQAYQEWIDPILKILIQKGKALECNTAGFRYGLGHPNPTEDILRRYHELGGEILTVGSDAHQPDHIGHAFNQISDLLKSCGFRYYAAYRARTPHFIPL